MGAVPWLQMIMKKRISCTKSAKSWLENDWLAPAFIAVYSLHYIQDLDTTDHNEITEK